MLASARPEIALGVVAIAPYVPYLTPGHPNYARYPFDEQLDDDEGWAKYNRHYWRARLPRLPRVLLLAACFPEPHSTKQIEDCVGWGLETDARDARARGRGPARPWASAEEAPAVCARVSLPGARPPRRPRTRCRPASGRRPSPLAEARRLARRARGRRATCPHARDPGEGEPADPRLRRSRSKGGRHERRHRTRRGSRPAPATRTRRATSSATASASSGSVYGEGEQTILLLPTWSIVHSRVWKMQIPYLARHCARACRSTGAATGAPTGRHEPEAYAEREFAADALAVMDATQHRPGDRRRLLGAARSRGARCSPASHPERVGGRRLHRPELRRSAGSRVPERPCTPSTRSSTPTRAGRSTTATTGSATIEGFLEFFMSTDASPSRTRRRRSRTASAGAWRLMPKRSSPGFHGWDTKEIDPETTRDLVRPRAQPGPAPSSRVRSRRPSWSPQARARSSPTSCAFGGPCSTAPGHAPQVRDPVKVNEMLRDFAGLKPPRPATLDARPPPAEVRALRHQPDRPGPRPARPRHRPGVAPA